MPEGRMNFGGRIFWHNQTFFSFFLLDCQLYLNIYYNIFLQLHYFPACVVVVILKIMILLFHRDYFRPAGSTVGRRAVGGIHFGHLLLRSRAGLPGLVRIKPVLSLKKVE